MWKQYNGAGLQRLTCNSFVKLSPVVGWKARWLVRCRYDSSSGGRTGCPGGNSLKETNRRGAEGGSDVWRRLWCHDDGRVSSSIRRRCPAVGRPEGTDGRRSEDEEQLQHDPSVHQLHIHRSELFPCWLRLWWVHDFFFCKWQRWLDWNVFGLN